MKARTRWFRLRASPSPGIPWTWLLLALLIGVLTASFLFARDRVDPVIIIGPPRLLLPLFLAG